MIFNPIFLRNFHVGTFHSTLRSCFRLRNGEIAHFPLFQDRVKKEIYVSNQQRQVLPITWTSPFYHPFISSNRAVLFDLNQAVSVLSRVNFVQQNQMAKMSRRHYELHHPSQPFQIELLTSIQSKQRSKRINPFWVSAFFFSILFASLVNNKKVSADENDPDRLSLEECREVAKILNLAGYTPSPILSPEQRLADFNAVCFAAAYKHCMKQQWESIRLLDEKGFLHRIVSDKGENLFLYAIRKGCRYIFEECINNRILYKRSDANGNHALHYLALYDRHAWIRKLSGWDVHAPNSQAELAIHLAIRKGHTKCIEELVKIGTTLLESNIWMPDGYFLSLVGYAVYHGRIDSLNTLLHLNPNLKAVLSQKVDKIGSLFHLSIQQGHKKVLDELITIIGSPINELLNMTDDEGRVPFHVACNSGNTYAMRTLARTGQNLTVVDKNNKNGFHFAAMGFQQEVIYYLYSFLGQEKGKQYLSQKDSQGRLPIDYLDFIPPNLEEGILNRVIRCRAQIESLIHFLDTKIPLPVDKIQHIHHLIIYESHGFENFLNLNAILDVQKQKNWEDVVDIGGYGIHGAILALLLALGYTHDELLNEKETLKSICQGINAFGQKARQRLFYLSGQDNFFGIRDPKIHTTRSRQDLYDLNYTVLSLIEKLILNKTNNEKTTFQQLHEKVVSNNNSSYKDLHIFWLWYKGDNSVLINANVYNWKNESDTPIIEAISNLILKYAYSMDLNPSKVQNLGKFELLPFQFFDDKVNSEDRTIPNPFTLELRRVYRDHFSNLHGMDQERIIELEEGE